MGWTCASGNAKGASKRCDRIIVCEPEELEELKEEDWKQTIYYTNAEEPIWAHSSGRWRSKLKGKGVVCKRCNPAAAVLQAEQEVRHVQIGTAGGKVYVHHVIGSAFFEEMEIRQEVLQKAWELRRWTKEDFQEKAIRDGEGRGVWWVPNHKSNGTVPL